MKNKKWKKENNTNSTVQIKMEDIPSCNNCKFLEDRRIYIIKKIKYCRTFKRKIGFLPVPCDKWEKKK